MKIFTKSALHSFGAIKLQHALELINPHLFTVEERIREQARIFDPAVEGYIAYACGSGGKRLRPALALLSGGATGTISPGHVDLAVIVELVHLAALIGADSWSAPTDSLPRRDPNFQVEPEPEHSRH